MGKEIKKIGIVAMPNISAGGGFPRVTVDLITALNSLGKKVSLLTPYKLNYKKIEELHGTINLGKVYYPSRFRKFFIRDTYISRYFIKKEFIKLARNTDLIIDLDGGILHKYLPKKFDNSKYVIWRISGTDSDIGKINLSIKDFKTELKMFFKKYIFKQPVPSRKHKIYPLDRWTGNEIRNVWNLKHENFYLYPEIKIDEFLESQIKKKKQIAIFGRLAPLKKIEDSLSIFAEGTKNYKKYNLIILGGTTSESDKYIDYIKSLSKKLEVSKRISIIKNPSFRKLKDVLLESKILIDSQRGVSLTMTAIEALAAGNIVLAYKNGGTFVEVLENGMYGYGFMTVAEGQINLQQILESIEKRKINPNTFRKRAEFFSGRSFINRLKLILKAAEDEMADI